MATRVPDIDGSRGLTFESDNQASPESIFVSGARGLCIQFDRSTLLTALKKEFGFIDPIEAWLNGMFEHAA